MKNTLQLSLVAVIELWPGTSAATLAEGLFGEALRPEPGPHVPEDAIPRMMGVLREHWPEGRFVRVRYEDVGGLQGSDLHIQVHALGHVVDEPLGEGLLVVSVPRHYLDADSPQALVAFVRERLVRVAALPQVRRGVVATFERMAWSDPFATERAWMRFERSAPEGALVVSTAGPTPFAASGPKAPQAPPRVRIRVEGGGSSRERALPVPDEDAMLGPLDDASPLSRVQVSLEGVEGDADFLGYVVLGVDARVARRHGEPILPPHVDSEKESALFDEWVEGPVGCHMVDERPGPVVLGRTLGLLEPTADEMRVDVPQAVVEEHARSLRAELDARGIEGNVGLYLLVKYDV